jgi:thiopurine S-methyltransferase
MQPDFWLERWRNNQIGFHEPAPHALLVAHFGALALDPGSRVFVPLCGKTLDIDWLLARGHRVAGVELSEDAVREVFERLGLHPDVRPQGVLSRWSAGDLDLFTGNMLDLQVAQLGEVAAVYDRAALIALPAPMRAPYAAQLSRITGAAPQLLITLEYDQACIEGPPFAVSGEEVARLYRDRTPTLLASSEVPGGLKGRCAATENAWLLPAGSSHGAQVQSRYFATRKPR